MSIMLAHNSRYGEMPFLSSSTISLANSGLFVTKSYLFSSVVLNTTSCWRSNKIVSVWEIGKKRRDKGKGKGKRDKGQGKGKGKGIGEREKGEGKGKGGKKKEGKQNTGGWAG